MGKPLSLDIKKSRQKERGWGGVVEPERVATKCNADLEMD